MTPRRAVFPGSFDPLTVGHLAVADAARARHGLDEVHLVISADPLGKDRGAQAPVDERIAAIARAGAGRPWLRAGTTTARLVVDIARGFDVVIVGADKWLQLHDPSFYGGSEAAMVAALRRLPVVAIAPRAGVTLPAGVEALAVDAWIAEVSSSAVRAGRDEWRA